MTGTLEDLTAAAVYAVLFVLVFVECGVLLGFLLPGDSVLFTAGLLSADRERGLDVALLAAVVVVAAFTGNLLGYWTGRRFGRPWLQHRTGRMSEHLTRAEAFYDRFGWWAVVVARFVPWARTFVPVVAGVAGMRRRSFLVANVVGALVWGAGLVVLGHAAAHVPQVKWAAYAVAAVAVLGSVVAALTFWLRGRRARALAGDGTT